ncbi:hypothetical protein JMF94_14835 [Desulfovibrio sp. UIB00]|uniref:hypothetical protein n=1 Tax=Desulfovibrio sp. UIB00 TaxID=2804314 RepID=UPI001F0D452A|nr:hypothetical protein [Desulfovibrio sp. UIB00]MCH5146357.1 hypothetical protein [Desulfovibrio sp. UIB00]
MPKAENLQKLMERKAKLDAKIQALRAREAKQVRKDDTRRKVLVGSLVLEAVKKNADIKAWLDGLLNKRLTRKDDRELFNLAPLEVSHEETAENADDESATDDAENVPSESAEVRYPVCIYMEGSRTGAWSPDFPTLGVAGKDSQEALGNAIEAIQNAVNNGTRPKPSTERAARQQFTIYAGQKFEKTPEIVVEWVAVE